MEIRKLEVEDYQELLNLLNGVFARKNQRETDFEKDLPKMWVKDEAHMSRHTGVFEDGKLVSSLGVYPLPLKVLDETLSFYTVGNVATHWDYAGKGYMSLLMDAAMKELQDRGADGSRLGGIRGRYNRYGYETAGQLYQFTFTKHNRMQYSDGAAYTFEKISATDESNIIYTEKVRTKLPSYVIRKKEDIYPSLTAWQNEAYVIKDGEVKKGYACIKGNTVSELGLEDEKDFIRALCSLSEKVDGDITVKCFPYEVERIRTAYKYAESSALTSPCHFKIINYEKVADAHVKLRNSYRPIKAGEVSIEIAGYGGLRLYSDGTSCGAERYNGKCDITATQLDATRILFGYADPFYMQNGGEKLAGFCPLPLTWNLQDRV